MNKDQEIAGLKDQLRRAENKMKEMNSIVTEFDLLNKQLSSVIVQQAIELKGTKECLKKMINQALN